MNYHPAVYVVVPKDIKMNFVYPSPCMYAENWVINTIITSFANCLITSPTIPVFGSSSQVSGLLGDVYLPDPQSAPLSNLNRREFSEPTQPGDRQLPFYCGRLQKGLHFCRMFVGTRGSFSVWSPSGVWLKILNRFMIWELNFLVLIIK